MSKVAVVFGGHGFIGSHLARSLIQSGDYSRVVCADIAAEPRFRTQGVEYVHCDVRNEIPSDLAPGVSEIYNLAAVHVTPGHEDWEYYWTNVLGATRVCDYASRAGVNTVVFTSSISVYGPSEEPLTEDSPLHPESAYGRSKYCAENIHRLWRDEAPAERHLIIARPSVIFGYTERGNFTRLAKLLKSGLFFYSGRKDTIKACGYVKDLVGTFAYFVAKNVSEITYNFAYTERLTIEDICKSFQSAIGYGSPKGVIPIKLIMLGGLAFEILNLIGLKTSINRARVMKLFRSTNIIPKRLDASGYIRKYPFAEALRDWYRDSGEEGFK